MQPFLVIRFLVSLRDDTTNVADQRAWESRTGDVEGIDQLCMVLLS